jgi:multidrug efflux pump subunit AcrA (membrane-fusion protein)
MLSKIITWLKNIFSKIKNKFLSLPITLKIVSIVVVIGLIGGGIFLKSQNSKSEVIYQTTVVTEGTLISSISGSGTITSVNSTSISSKISGTVTAVYVSNGDTVTEGQEIATVELDDYALSRQTEAWNDYLDAQEAVKTAKKNKAEADLSMWQARQAIIDAEDAIEEKNTNSINPATNEEYTLTERTIIDKSLEKAQLAFDEAEAKYKNADAEISEAQTQVTSALRDYQQNSATIVAPTDGVVSNLNLAEGMVVSSTSNSNSTSSNENSINAISSQSFGKITDPNGSLLATISLSEIDVVNVKANQKANLILDAYEDKSFTGSVLAVDTSGSSNSGVTAYDVTIVLDPVSDVEIYSNMAVTADITTYVEPDVLLVDSTAIKTQSSKSYVQVMKDNEEIENVTIEVGESNDSQTVINSGLSSGEIVVISIIDMSKTDDSDETTSSPFSGVSTGTTRGTGMGGGGGTPPGGF